MKKTDWGVKRWDSWDSEENEEKDVVMIDSKTDEMPHAVWPLVQRKVKAQRQQTQQVDSPQFRKHIWEDILLLSLLKEPPSSSKRPGGKIQAKLVHASDMTSHLDFIDQEEDKENKQHYHNLHRASPACVQGVPRTYSLVGRVILLYRKVWPNEEVFPGHLEPWKSIKRYKKFLDRWEWDRPSTPLSMDRAMFTVEMKAKILQCIPSTWYGMLIFTLTLVLGQDIYNLEQSIADLGETDKFQE